MFCDESSEKKKKSSETENGEMTSSCTASSQYQTAGAIQLKNAQLVREQQVVRVSV